MPVRTPRVRVVRAWSTRRRTGMGMEADVEVVGWVVIVGEG